ncbi:protein VAPYRIN-LIKE-like [Fagus crenata]
MAVAVSLITTNPSVYSFNEAFTVIPPLSSLSYTLLLSQPSDRPLSSPPDIITVRSSMLLIGKAQPDYLRRLFSKPGPHIPEIGFFWKKAISECTGTQLTSLLRPAILYSNANFVTDILDAGADVNYKDSDRRSMITLAIRAGDLDILKVLIASGCKIDNSVDRILHEAAAVDRVDLMEVLFKIFGDSDVNSVDLDGRMPIHVAAVRGFAEVIRFCVSVGGKADVSDRNGWSPLHYAAAEGHLQAVEYLLECCNVKYMVNNDGKSAFALAVENGHFHLLDLLHLGDALHRAARVDDIHGMKTCLAEGLAEGANVNGRDQNGWTPLHRAAFKGRIESVKLLLNHGAQVDVFDDAGYAPLHCAIERGHVQVALLLFSHGAKANVKSLKGVIPLNFDHFKNHPTVVHPLCHEKERA